MDTEEFIEAIEEAGFDTRSYSGRGMMGAYCVGVDLENDGDLWRLSNALGLAGLDVPQPRTDSMGRDIIAYWPRFKIEAAA